MSLCQLRGVGSPMCLYPLKPYLSYKRKLRRRAQSESASEGTKIHPKFTNSDVQRICTQGPTFDDLKLHHTMMKRTSLGKTEEEKITYIREETFGKGVYREEPNWRKMKKISFMEFYKGIEERNWRSEFFNSDSVPWEIEFFEDAGRLFRPSFLGYRAVVREAGKDPVFCNMPKPGIDPYEADYLMPRPEDYLRPLYKTKTAGSPADYGYLQLFKRLGMAFGQDMPSKLVSKYEKRGYLKPKDAQQLYNPSEGLLDVSFHLTRREPTFHFMWEVVPNVAMIVFSMTFLGICLFVGVFKPKKQMPADPIQAMEFAQSKGRARKDGRTGVFFDEIAGLDNVIDDLKELVEFLKAPSQYQGLHAKPPKGVLLEGPPGTGKTLIAKAVANEAGVPFYQMSGSEFVEAIVGVGAARIRDLFKRARSQKEACIIFVDEIDALGTKRAEAGIMTNEEREQTLNQLLTEMDGFSSEMGVVFIGATNRSDLLDPALTRPGRFDRKIRVLKPNTEDRHKILQIHARNHKLSEDVDLMQLARDLPGLSGADLANVLNVAALEAIRKDAEEITPTEVYLAIDRVVQGLPDPVQPAELKIGRLFAVHEIGRAIVALVLRERTGRLEAVEKVSIVSRGSERTRTVFFRGKDEDYIMTTRSRMLERLCVILAGRAAEEHFYGEPSTYGVKSLGLAFRLAEKIAANYGLTDMGITSYAPVIENSQALKRCFEITTDNIDEDLFGRELEGGMFQPCDSSIHKLLTKCYELMWNAYQESLDIIKSYTNALEAGSKILLEKREITGAELEKIVRQYPPKPLKKPAQLDLSEVYAQQVPSPLSTKQDIAEEQVVQDREVEKTPVAF